VPEHLAGEDVVPRVQWRELAHQLEDVSVTGEPVEQHAAGGQPLPHGHTERDRLARNCRARHRVRDARAA
jgi:hypothetical protein